MPWCYDLPQRFRERFGRDLLPLRQSLFVGNAASDRDVRRQFWSLVADLVAERYFGAIQARPAAHHVASSGHSLWEEMPLHHVAIEGNGLKVLGRLDIPGEDVLSSDPEAVIYGGWMTAAMPSSAALGHRCRWVMTETSDFAQVQGGQGPAGLAEMRATAAWQAAWGVTDFTLYYSLRRDPFRSTGHTATTSAGSTLSSSRRNCRPGSFSITPSTTYGRSIFPLPNRLRWNRNLAAPNG